MKKIILCFLLLILFTNFGYSKTYTITNSGLSFSPSTLTINVGDTVNFALGITHNAREVDQGTWNANGSTSNGGFDTPDGGGAVVFSQPGTVYYVCKYHASSGMKGIITVSAVTTDLETANSTIPQKFILMQNFPNPFNPSTTIRYGLVSESNVSIRLYNLAGQQLKELISKKETAGFHEINFNADKIASGIYFYRIIATSINGSKSFIDTKKLLLLK